MIEIGKDDIRILVEGLKSYWESIAAGNYEDSEKDDSERIPELITVLENYRDQK